MHTTCAYQEHSLLLCFRESPSHPCPSSPLSRHADLEAHFPTASGETSLLARAGTSSLLSSPIPAAAGSDGSPAKPRRRARDRACVLLETYLKTAHLHDPPAIMVKEVNKYLLRVSVSGDWEEGFRAYRALQRAGVPLDQTGFSVSGGHCMLRCDFVRLIGHH